MSAKKAPLSARAGAGCMMLFALPFLAFGVGMGGCGAWTAAKVRDAQRWVEVPAVVKTVELKRGEKNSRRVLATYEYEFGGRKYSGERVSLHSGGDSLGRFQTSAHEELERHRRTGKPFRCFVNPRDPAESVLYRDVRWEMMLLYCGVAALFGSAGVGVLAASVVTWRRQPGRLAGSDLAERPWEARADWAAGRIGPSDAVRAAVPATSAVALWWMLASAPLVATWPLIATEAQTRWSWLVLAPPAVGVLIVVYAVYLAIRRRRFGESVFEMASVPGVVGGPLTGVVRIPKMIQPENGFRLRLLCMSQSRGRNNHDEHERAIWQDERFVERAMEDGSGGVAVPVMMAIPYTARPTSDADKGPRIRWLLEIFAELPGVNYKSEFEVPVFKTDASRPDFQLDPQLTADYASPPDNDLFLREAGIIKEPGPNGGVRLVFPAGRNPGSALVATVAAAAFVGGAWLMLHNGVMILFPIVLGLMGALFTLVALDSWFYRSVVEASASGLCVRGGLMGIGRSRTYPPDDIRRFRSAESMSSGKHVWCTISVETRSDKRQTIGKNISSKLTERAVIEELNAALGRVVPVTQKKSKVEPRQ